MPVTCWATDLSLSRAIVCVVRGLVSQLLAVSKERSGIQIEHWMGRLVN